MVTYRTLSLIALLLQTWTKILGFAKHQDSIIESLQLLFVNLTSSATNGKQCQGDNGFSRYPGAPGPQVEIDFPRSTYLTNPDGHL
jgi:hypothetical protein